LIASRTLPLERSASPRGLAPPIGNKCARAIPQREPDQQANVSMPEENLRCV
jgi:hypothetical protein